MKKIGLYALDPFSNKNPTDAESAAMLHTAQTIADAGFNWVILASFHVSSEGVIAYNDAPIIPSDPAKRLSPNLADCIDVMAAPGTVLASFGGGGEFEIDGKWNAIGYWDFSHIRALIQRYPNPAENPFFRNLQKMFDTYPAISGIDIDLEANTTQDYYSLLDTVARVAHWASERNKIVAICPYNNSRFWCDVITAASSNGKARIDWVNLQSAQAHLGEFAGPLSQVGIKPGQIIGGMQLSGGGVKTVKETFQQISSQYADIGGGWLWNLDGIQPISFATAVTKGLGAS